MVNFVLGLSTRKVGEVLLSLLGRPVSVSTNSRVAKTLEKAVAAFHVRPLTIQYKALVLDGVVLAPKTGAGALKRRVLVALGIRHDGGQEIIDFRLAASESAAEWERFLTDLWRRSLTGEGLEVICANGGPGLIGALPVAYPAIPLRNALRQRDRGECDEGKPAGTQPRRRRRERRRGAISRPYVRCVVGRSSRDAPVRSPC